MARSKPSGRYGHRAEIALGLTDSPADGPIVPFGLGPARRKIQETLPKIDDAKAKNTILQRKKAKRAR